MAIREAYNKISLPAVGELVFLQRARHVLKYQIFEEESEQACALSAACPALAG